MTVGEHTDVLPTLRVVLQQGLDRERGLEPRIRTIRRLEYLQSSHSIARLLVILESGQRLQVIAKRLRPGHKRYGNEREILTYRRLLAGKRFGAPALYGSLYDESRRRFVLFLEDVGSETIEDGDIGAWLQTMTLLANMHASYLGRDDELRALGCLHEHDLEYYRTIAQDARASLARAGTRGAQRRLARCLDAIEAPAGFLCRGPRTLVHGDLFPDNVMLQCGTTIRPIDWESAAIGMGATDIAGVLEGWTGDQRDLLVAAYRQGLEQHAGAAAHAADFAAQLRACEVLQPLRYLAWGAEYCSDPVTANDLLSSLEQGLSDWNGTPDRG